MDKKILDEIYKKIVYPSEAVQKQILVSEKKMQEKYKSIQLSEIDRENLLNIFMDCEQEVRKELFAIGFRFGIDVMLDYLKNDVIE